MLEQGQFWRNRELREHVAVIENKLAPTIVFQNSTYLNMHTKTWMKANIWVYKDRIVYVGDRMPANIDNTEIIECTGQYLVPGYIEPHAHPFILYNPEALALYAAKFGTTTLINDNLRLLSLFDKKKAFTIIENFHKMAVSMFWWGRYDSQSMLQDADETYHTDNILSWLNHPAVIQGGELTSWPQLLAGDDRLLYWIQETKRLKKRVEGHLPGASIDTLTKLKLLGTSGDHEAMTGDDILKRLVAGYHVTLRYSSIRPDLPKLLDELLQLEIDAYDQLMFTTDGSTPAFNEQGLMNRCIEIAIEKGVPIVEAYRMASFNVAKYLGLDELIGSIAPGRLAHINILYEQTDPTPLSVLAKGRWIMKDGKEIEQSYQVNWEEVGMKRAEYNFKINDDDLQFSIPIGLKMENDVIMKPYAVDIDITADHLPQGTEEAFLLLLDRNGKWRVNTVIHGFTSHLGALCSSYSTTNDIILIGKRKADMIVAFERMKEIGGGIILAHEGKVIFELPLTLQGAMYADTMEKLIEKEKKCVKILEEAGYTFNDPIYTLLFLSSTHLPYIRVTQQGLIDVMKKEVIVPANMR